MSDLLTTSIKPFILYKEEFLTDEEKASAIDMKDFSTHFRRLNNEQDYREKLNEKVFFAENTGSKKYYKFQIDAKPSIKYIGEHAHFVALFKIEKNESLADIVMQVSIREDKGKKEIHRKETFTSLEKGNIACLPIIIYLRNNKYR